MKKILEKGIILFLLLLVFLVANPVCGTLALVYVFAILGWNLPMPPPQDCMGVTFSVKGYVTDEEVNPIAGAHVHAFNQGSYELPPFDVRTISDEHGYFEVEPVTSFACTPFEVEIAAEGYDKQTITFYPPGEEWPGELPSLMSVTLQQAHPATTPLPTIERRRSSINAPLKVPRSNRYFQPKCLDPRRQG